MEAVYERIIGEQCGFVDKKDVPDLERVNPNIRVLVRCGAGRYLCGLSDLEAVFELVARRGDYVRDVSLPHEDCCRIKAGLKPFTLTRTYEVA
jgi:hypothetical protein